ncbi:MAG: hypothetical protein B7X06_03895 [Verrucomicrobia bacterium 21-51-4]|nr:MAG: hypothetical protein B7X06_03895 [Verrucomicrobia bacterium 21-51-4]
MEELFFQWGILADNWIIVDPIGSSQASSGDYIIRRFAEHPITQFLIDYQLTVVAGLCRPIRLDIGASFDAHREVSPLMASSNDSWAQRSFNPYKIAKFDPTQDLQGPLSIAVVSEHSLGSQLGLQVPGGRLVVFGSADIIANHHLKLLGNEGLFLNAMLWGVRRENLVSVLPRSIEEYQLSLSRAQLGSFGIRLLILPTILALMGVIVFLKRRR